MAAPTSKLFGTADTPEQEKKRGSETMSNPSRFTELSFQLPMIKSDIKMFGLMTALTMAVVVGMSIYVVHYHNQKINVRGDRLTNDAGTTLITANPESTVNTLFETLQLETSALRRIEDIIVFVALPHGELAQVILRVDRFMRFVDSGRTEICSSGGACILVGEDDDPNLMNANYTDGRHCPTSTSCPVRLDGPQGQATRRQLMTARRRLWSWNPVSWFTSPPPAPPPPVWKADDSCPWICKQGWKWESNAYGKPACCQETKDSGSPYDTCQYPTCMCDAACSGCCNT